MNKRDYIETINEIKADETLKNRTLNKMKRKKSFYIKKYVFATAVATILIVTAIAIPLKYPNKQQIIAKAKQDEILPKIENFDNLYNMMKNRANINENETKSIESAARFQEEYNETAKNLTDAADYSETNTQVKGVDEADIVKTDGNYIYYVENSKITIIDARDANKLKIQSEINFENQENEYYSPLEIFIEDDRLVVIGKKRIYDKSENTNKVKYYSLSTKQFSSAKIYKISDKSKPEFVREVEIEGDYLNARMIGENVYLISNKYMNWGILSECKVEELQEDDYKPLYIDTAKSQEVKTLEFSDIRYFPNSDDTSYLNIASFNVNKNNEANIKSYLGAGTSIYASKENLYITKEEYKYNDELINNQQNYSVKTCIYKFKLEDEQVIFENEGSVPGTILNQFSMDEKDGFFRIATTNSKSWDNKTNTNNLYILDQNLEIVGKIEDLAPGERIYSVRFVGERAYMVTFVETDPLFVIDLKEPTEPKVLGELKIPGYSKYLHPYDENHIIGFGEDTKTENYGYGDVIVTNGMKMAMFDVTDPNDPKELFSTKIGDKGTFSEILYDHKALLYSKEKNIIAFPIRICKNSNNDRNSLNFQGAIVYGLDLNKGFYLKGQIAHMRSENGYERYDYTKNVERIIYIKDNLFTLSKGLIKATDINTMKEVGNIEIEVKENNYSIIEETVLL